MAKHVSAFTYEGLCALGVCSRSLVRVSYIDESCKAMTEHQYGIVLESTSEQVVISFEGHRAEFYWKKPGGRKITSIQKLPQIADIVSLQEAYLATPESVPYSPPWEPCVA